MDRDELRESVRKWMEALRSNPGLIRMPSGHPSHFLIQNQPGTMSLIGQKQTLIQMLRASSSKGINPLLWAAAFAGLDVIWIAFIFISESSALTQSWNAAHAPVRALAEPLLLPVVTSHPNYPGADVWVLYFGICVLQFAFIGYVLGRIARSMKAS